MIESAQGKNHIVFLPGKRKLGIQIDRSDNDGRVQGLPDSPHSLQTIEVTVTHYRSRPPTGPVSLRKREVSVGGADVCDFSMRTAAEFHKIKLRHHAELLDCCDIG